MPLGAFAGDFAFARLERIHYGRAMGNLAYRVAKPEDHALVVEMLSELIDELGPDDESEDIKTLLEEDIRAAFDSSDVRIFIAEFEGEPVGLSRGDVHTADPIFRLRKDQRCGYVDQMFVRQGHRDRGIGGQLLRMCEEFFREKGVQHSILHAAPKAVRFYARVGYQPNREMFKKL
jgi:GNAT superfamily N-acetyltransferase